MVKGISRQVIVVHAPNEALFEQAIFILREEAVTKGVTDEMLMKQAQEAIRMGTGKRRIRPFYEAVWACGGAVLTGLLWLICSL